MGEMYRMSTKLVSTIMVILQKGLLEQTDVGDLLSSLELIAQNGEIDVLNPPTSIKTMDSVLEEDKPLILTGE